MTSEKPIGDWTSAWPDALGFVVGLAVAWWAGWTASDLVWSLWLSSFVVGYAAILWSVFGPAIQLGRHAWGDRAFVKQAMAGPQSPTALIALLIVVVGALLLLAFFTFHFGMFHYIHSQFLISFFPIETVDTVSLRRQADMTTYAEVLRRYWWFLPAAFLAERAAFVREPAPAVPDLSVTAAAIAARKAANASKGGPRMLAPYRNVMRMHVLIFFFAFAHFAEIDNFAVYAVVYAVYFFPVGLVTRRREVRAYAG
jgi:hypothetical protein